MSTRWRFLISRLLGAAPLAVRAFANRVAAERALSRVKVHGPPGAPALLFFNHFFDQDVRALAHAARHVRLVVIEAPDAFRFARHLFPSDIVDMRASYDSAPAAARRMHHRTCEILLRKARSRFGVGAIGATNDGFYWYRECLAAAADLGMPRIVVDKEGTISPHDWDHEAQRLRRFAPFASDRIYVWSDRQRRFWRSVGAQEQAIVVTGQPRSDLLFLPGGTALPSDVPSGRPIATFFAFSPDAYVPPHIAGRESAWSDLLDACLDAIGEAAAACPEAMCIVKLHPQDPAEAYCRDRLGGSVPNVSIRRDSHSGYSLLVNSTAVVAFQSTVTIEAGALGVPVLYPAWDPLSAQLRADLLDLERLPHVEAIASPSEMASRLIEVLWTDGPLPRVTPEPNEYLERADGTVSDRILADVAALVAR